MHNAYLLFQKRAEAEDEDEELRSLIDWEAFDALRGTAINNGQKKAIGDSNVCEIVLSKIVHIAMFQKEPSTSSDWNDDEFSFMTLSQWVAFDAVPIRGHESTDNCGLKNTIINTQVVAVVDDILFQVEANVTNFTEQTIQVCCNNEYNGYCACL